jgi:hypothetical protein
MSNIEQRMSNIEQRMMKDPYETRVTISLNKLLDMDILKKEYKTKNKLSKRTMNFEFRISNFEQRMMNIEYRISNKE